MSLPAKSSDIMLDDRFWRHVHKPDDPDACWRWEGALDRGRPMYFVKCQKVWPRQLVWEAENGPVPEGLMLDSQCRRKDCLRPDHMFLKVRPYGRTRELTRRELETVRRLYLDAALSVSAIADRLKVSEPIVMQALREMGARRDGGRPAVPA